MPTGPIAPTPLTTPLPCWHESLSSARTDQIVALSERLARIQTDRPLKPGTAVFLELADDATIEAVATDDVGHGSFVVAFLTVDEGAAALIRRTLGTTAVAEIADATIDGSGVADDVLLPRTRTDELFTGTAANQAPGDTPETPETPETLVAPEKLVAPVAPEKPETPQAAPMLPTRTQTSPMSMLAFDMPPTPTPEADASFAHMPVTAPTASAPVSLHTPSETTPSEGAAPADLSPPETHAALGDGDDVPPVEANDVSLAGIAAVVDVPSAAVTVEAPSPDIDEEANFDALNLLDDAAVAAPGSAAPGDIATVAATEANDGSPAGDADDDDDDFEALNLLNDPVQATTEPPAVDRSAVDDDDDFGALNILNDQAQAATEPPAVDGGAGADDAIAADDGTGVVVAEAPVSVDDHALAAVAVEADGGAASDAPGADAPPHDATEGAPVETVPDSQHAPVTGEFVAQELAPPPSWPRSLATVLPDDDSSPVEHTQRWPTARLATSEPPTPPVVLPTQITAIEALTSSPTPSPTPAAAAPKPRRSHADDEAEQTQRWPQARAMMLSPPPGPTAPVVAFEPRRPTPPATVTESPPQTAPAPHIAERSDAPSLTTPVALGSATSGPETDDTMDAIDVTTGAHILSHVEPAVSVAGPADVAASVTPVTPEAASPSAASGTSDDADFAVDFSELFDTADAEPASGAADTDGGTVPAVLDDVEPEQATSGIATGAPAIVEESIDIVLEFTGARPAVSAMPSPDVSASDASPAATPTPPAAAPARSVVARPLPAPDEAGVIDVDFSEFKDVLGVANFRSSDTSPPVVVDVARISTPIPVSVALPRTPSSIARPPAKNPFGGDSNAKALADSSPPSVTGASSPPEAWIVSPVPTSFPTPRLLDRGFDPVLQSNVGANSATPRPMPFAGNSGPPSAMSPAPAVVAMNRVPTPPTSTGIGQPLTTSTPAAPVALAPVSSPPSSAAAPMNRVPTPPPASMPTAPAAPPSGPPATGWAPPPMPTTAATSSPSDNAFPPIAVGVRTTPTGPTEGVGPVVVGAELTPLTPSSEGLPLVIGDDDDIPVIIGGDDDGH